MKTVSKPSRDVVRFFPAKASEGDRIFLRLADPLPGTAVPKVTVGGKALKSARLLNRFTVVGDLPADQPGKKAVTVGVPGPGKRSAVLTVAGSFEHKGKRLAETGPRAWRKILHYLNKDKDGGTVSAFAQGKDSDPTRPGSNWWMSGGSLSHDAHAHTALAMAPVQLWQYASPDADIVYYNEPVLSEDNLILASITNSGTGEVLVVLDAATGAKRWSWETTTMGRIDSTAVCVNGRVYVVQLVAAAGAQRNAKLICANASDGAIFWDYLLQANAPTAFTRLAAAYGLIYAMTPDGMLRGIDATTGALLWTAETPVPLYPHILSDQSIAVAGGKVYIGSMTGLRAYDPGTGALLWSSSQIFDCSFSPVVATIGTNPLLVITGDFDGMIRAFDYSGALRWTYSGSLQLVDFYSRMACGPELLYVQQENGMVALDLATGVVQATSPALGSLTSGGPTASDNRVLQFCAQPQPSSTGAGKLQILDRDNLSFVGSLTLPNGISLVRPVLEGDRLYFGLTSVIGQLHNGIMQAWRVR